MQIHIRPWHAKDLEPLATLANNKKIWNNVRDYFPHPYTSKDAKEWLALNVGITPVLNFVIEADGSISNVKVIKGISDVLDKECIRLVKAMPKWKPAHINGINVSSEFILPFQFE